MTKIRRKTLAILLSSVLAALLFSGVLLLGGCRKAGESAQGDRKTRVRAADKKKAGVEERAAVPPAGTTPAGPRHPNGQATFDPRLLLSDAATAPYTVQLAPLTAPLEDKGEAIVTLSFECTSDRATERIKKDSVKIQALAREILSKKSFASANSAEGKMEIREEIVRATTTFLGYPGVKQVHYLNFIVN